MLRIFFSLLLGLAAVPAQASAPETFADAKRLLREQVYADQNLAATPGSLYCGCQWDWTGTSGGRMRLNSCGYRIRALQVRAQRLEWEHIVPASWLGRQRQCWQQGGRQNCTDNDPFFSLMEADLHNLAPVIGEVNADRSNYRFGMAGADAKGIYGACQSRTDFKARIFEPRPEVRGFVARVMFYMHDRYNLSLSKNQQQLLLQWHRRWPVTGWELERDRRIAAITGQGNPFVSGERQWRLGHKNSADGLTRQANQGKARSEQPKARTAAVIGNRNSKIYHLRGCPGYSDTSERNAVPFNSSAAARAAGYRAAKNCKP